MPFLCALRACVCVWQCSAAITLIIINIKGIVAYVLDDVYLLLFIITACRHGPLFSLSLVDAPCHMLPAFPASAVYIWRCLRIGLFQDPPLYFRALPSHVSCQNGKQLIELIFHYNPHNSFSFSSLFLIAYCSVCWEEVAQCMAGCAHREGEKGQWTTWC